MPETCMKCVKSIKGDPIKCGAFCSSVVCQRCSGMTKDMLPAITANIHLVWMCIPCKDMFAKGRSSNALKPTSNVNESNIDTMKTEIRDSILLDIKNEIRLNFKSLIESTSSSPAHRTPLAPSSRTKRRRVNDGDEVAIAHRPIKAFCATGTSASDPSLVASRPADHDQERFWLYLSGISPEVPESKITELAQEKLNTNDLKVIKLVPRDKDVKSLTFVSYKIGMSPDLKTVALSTETWPCGIRFREFEDVGSKKQFFWRPTPAATRTDAVSNTQATVPAAKQ